ncbi:MAG: hypothetical protein ACXVAE_06260 [Candidatus Limnocylindrales bacterium]
MTVTIDEVRGWFAGRLTEGWFSAPPEVRLDREEILVLGELKDVELEKGASEATRAAARQSRVEAFREESRGARMAIAEDAQHRFRRVVSWGVRIGGEEHLFTTASVPVMTRLRMEERQTLDTLVAAGVARSRSEALGWCVKLVGEHASEWIDGLREALSEVEKRRAGGPKLN